MIPIVIKHGSESLDLGLRTPDTLVSHLKADLEARLGVFERHQKLIYKGKVLDPTAKLSDALSIPGSTIAPLDHPHPAIKLMLLVSQQQGNGGGVAPLTKVTHPAGYLACLTVITHLLMALTVPLAAAMHACYMSYCHVPTCP